MFDKGTLSVQSVISIGVIGQESLIEKTKEALQSFPNFNPLFCVPQSEDEIPDLARRLTNEVEVLMFLEYRGYKKTKDMLEFHIPVHHVPLMGTGLYQSLFHLKNIYGLKLLSIDTVDVKYAKQILLELQETDSQIFFYDTPVSSTIEEIVAFHLQNYQEKKTIAMTGIQAVSDKLTEQNVPNEWVTPTHQDLIVSLERALLATETRRNKEAQIVVGLINIDDFRHVVEKYPSEHDVQQLKLDIHRMLLDYIKQLDGHLINMGGGEYLFFTTRGIFERETRGYKFIPILQDAKKSIGITLSIGIGFGRSAIDAGTHARLALRQSKESGGNICYIVRENRSVIGPVDVTTPMRYELYDLSITDSKILDEAEKAGMSASYMTKLMAQISRYGKTDYTAQELASILDITVRSAHRILLQWMDAELIDIVGEEKLSSKGRPRRIYRLSFVTDQLNKMNIYQEQNK
ncbi:hypothetical protein MUB24_09960 [Lederbergia sp. NSJ-179]|uniref:hypothetical protein n=1 Tax=Lederbergia sp. NSJ-179 TaxID=2931402 RepID=UPI001FD0D3C7|nr:hypothetical protein [Lederbergia sp. NSJ-179]MCJ7841216.1 hypothetical protein [Lederbergia sp. NSJ-179]